MLDRQSIPAQAIVDVPDEPSAAMLPGQPPALVGLLRLALLSGVDLNLPSALRLVLDVAQSVAASDRQLIVFGESRPGASARSQIAQHFDPLPPPSLETNLLHAWTQQVRKPVVVERGLASACDAYLELVGSRAALAVPLFVAPDWDGSIQLFRTGSAGFTLAEARLAWMLSIVAKSQMERIHDLQRLTRMAYTDFLTGVRARGYFEQALDQEVHRTLRTGSSCGLVLVDLDDFKLVNDRYGHRNGDEVLQQFARLLQQDMREVDTVARYGGDEFALILPDAGEAGVRLAVDRLHAVVRGHAFTVPGSGEHLRLSLSVGVALCPGDERSPELLLRAADCALYQAKQRGKDRPLFTRELRHAS